MHGPLNLNVNIYRSIEVPHYSALINRNTGGRCDVSPIFEHPDAFSALVRDLLAPIVNSEVTAVAAIDALGFVLGTALAHQLTVPLVLIRKGGKLPTAIDRESFVDYSGAEKVLEIKNGSIRSGARILVVDEWIETGAQAQAAAALIERQGGQVIGICAINIDDRPATRGLASRYHCWSAVSNTK
ncbi:MAG: adenine phosphoribosyltransferase [Ideonella sp. MAG2]|nr:MAG: adenine phosphoribosyltransferase [Ideonella sp. MAG2]